MQRLKRFGAKALLGVAAFGLVFGGLTLATPSQAQAHGPGHHGGFRGHHGHHHAHFRRPTIGVSIHSYRPWGGYGHSFCRPVPPPCGYGHGYGGW